MNGGRSKLNRKQEAAITALLTEKTRALAAGAAGIAEATLARWMKLPDFARAYREARFAVLEDAVGNLQQVADKAVGCLARNLDAPRVADQIRAAVAILEHAHKGSELLHLADRVAELERLLEADGDVPAEPNGQAGEDSSESPSRDGSSLAEPHTAGPQPDHVVGGDESRPLAAESPALELPAPPLPLFPPVGKEPDGGRNGDS